VTIRVPFNSLTAADLAVGAVYEGGTSGNASDDPMARLLPCGNQGGFRIRGQRTTHSYRMALLYTSGADPDWPDALDPETGLFTYFGDNKQPGSQLHDTRRGGNELLRFSFDAIHAYPPARHQVPPFFVFRKATPGPGRDVEFLGVAVPGGADVAPLDDLVAVWRTKAGQRFQNYQATFTVLDAAAVPRAWIVELDAGNSTGPNSPQVFRQWVDKGIYRPLESPRTISFRTPADQAPASAQDAALVQALYEHFSPDPYRFEACAIELWKMAAKESVSVVATRRTRDSGRDAYGIYSIGPSGDRVHLDFSLEAKCYKPGRGCGVKDTSRLISRLRHRHFGVFVTASHVGPQPYQEIREDGHPVVILAGRDIAELLKQHGISTVAAVQSWLAASFPMPSP
jgi:hypothetical protein